MYFISIVIGYGTRFMCLYVNFILFHKLFDQHNSSVNQRSLFQCNLYYTTRTLAKTRFEKLEIYIDFTITRVRRLSDNRILVLRLNIYKNKVQIAE